MLQSSVTIEARASDLDLGDKERKQNLRRTKDSSKKWPARLAQLLGDYNDHEIPVH